MDICQTNDNEVVETICLQEADIFPLDTLGIPPQTKREPKKCSMCHKYLVNLPRHMEDVHLVSKNEALFVSQNQRKRKNPTNKGRPCPLAGCENKAPYKSLDKHLLGFHKLLASSEEYRKYVKSRNTTKFDKLSREGELWSKKYFDFLLSVDGGGSNPEAANQQRLHIRQIVNGISIQHIKEIITEEGVAKLHDWFQDFIKGHEASSAITYLSTLINFLRYLISIKLDNFSHERYSLLRMRFNKWKCAFRKSKMGHQKFVVPDVSREDINDVLNSPPVKQMKKIAIKLENQTTSLVSMEDHTLFRSVLITLTTLRNACRSCNLYNMSVSEFNHALKVVTPEEETYYVISVANHKTVNEHGPAQVVLDSDLHRYYSIYCSNIRPYILKRRAAACNFVFLTYVGTKLTPNEITKGLKYVCQKSGLKELGTTLIRKLVTTETHQYNRSLIPSVAAHLKHHVSTAESSYKLYKRAEVSVDTSKQILDMLQNMQTNSSEEISKPVLESSTENETSSVTLGKLRCRTKNSDPKPKNKPLPRPYCENDFAGPSTSSFGGNSSFENINSIPTRKRGKGNPFYSPEERMVILKAFEKDVKCGKVPSNKIIRDTICGHPVLSTWPEERQSIVKFRGCLQNLVNKIRN